MRCGWRIYKMMGMFNFLKKKNSDIILDVRYSGATITSDVLPNYTKSVPQPTWYRNLEKSSHCPMSNGRGIEFKPKTTKACPGIIGTFTKGIYLLCPFDILFYRDSKQGKTIFYAPQDYENRLDQHADSQMNNAFRGNFLTLKINPGYSIRCKENVNFMMTYPILANASINSGNVFGPDGIINFKYQHNANIFLHVKTHLGGHDEKIMIRKGTPLAHLMPLTERNVVLKYTETPDCIPTSTGYLGGVSSFLTMKRLHNKLDEEDK